MPWRQAEVLLDSETNLANVKQQTKRDPEELVVVHISRARLFATFLRYPRQRVRNPHLRQVFKLK